MVNTFLPYADFERTARVLDTQRLGKQRVEARQIINIIAYPDRYTGWKFHPAVLMWRGPAHKPDAYLPYLKRYYNAIVTEWVRRGYRNTMALYAEHELKTRRKAPWWLGHAPFHRSHRANLLRKNYAHYSRFFHVPNWTNVLYVWPSESNRGKLNPTAY